MNRINVSGLKNGVLDILINQSAIQSIYDKPKKQKHNLYTRFNKI